MRPAPTRATLMGLSSSRPIDSRLSEKTYKLLQACNAVIGRLNLKVVVAALLALSVGGGLLTSRLLRAPTRPVDTSRTVQAEKGVVQATASATGSVQPPSELTLSFKQSAKLVAVNVKAGDHVDEGALLAEID